jgi:hypothetical protein
LGQVLHLGEGANGGEVGAVHFKNFKHEFSTEETFGGQNLDVNFILCHHQQI